jgi:hypothetical protein
VLQVRRPDPDAPRPYDHTPVPALVTAPANAAEFTWSLFNGAWPWVPDFRTLAPVATGTSTSITLPTLTASEPFGLAFTGHFHAPTGGDYEVTVASDTGATLFLHDMIVVAEPLHAASIEHRARVRLAAGWHPLRLCSRHSGAPTPRLEFSARPLPRASSV